MSYEDFLKSKAIVHQEMGFECDLSDTPLYPSQCFIVETCLRRGRSAIFADTGYGKMIMELFWSKEVYQRINQNILIFAPCGVNSQIVDEGARFGVEVNRCSSQDDVKPGINITNYEKMHKFDSSQFGAIVLDESSILKGFQSKYRAQLTEFVQGIDYRLAATATPSPNDLIELINHADWLGIMSGKEAIANFFTQDGNSTKKWRLKNTCKQDFWQWVASWAICVRKPSDLGFNGEDGCDLPGLNIYEVMVDSEAVMTSLLPIESLGLSERRQLRKDSLNQRVQAVADLVNSSADQWVVWCDFNDESEALTKAIADSIEIKGSQDLDRRELEVKKFICGDTRVLISKPSILGFGLNFQFCHKTAFVGVSDSFEQQYQAIRRFYRRGQTKVVDVYLVASQQESAVIQNIRRKEKQADDFFKNVKAAMKKLVESEGKVEPKISSKVESRIESGSNWKIYLGDNVQRIKELKDESIDLAITSVPFPGMYAYTDDLRDMGNVKDYAEYFGHFNFLVPEMLRVTKPGRSFCIHLTQGVAMVGRDGHMGLKDFRGDTIRAMQDGGFIYAGEVTIDQDPQLEAVRNNTHGLLFKSLSTDAAQMRMALADYVLIFRKPGKNFEPIKAGKSPKYNPDGGWITEDEWIEWAAPVWYRHVAPGGRIATAQPCYPSLQRNAMHETVKGDGKVTRYNGIHDTDVANVAIARDPRDERHLCPLQYGIIERCVKLFSNPGDLVLDPFNGVGSTGIKSIELGRQYVGFEIKESYFNTAAKYLKQAETGKMQRQMTIFDVA